MEEMDSMMAAMGTSMMLAWLLLLAVSTAVVVGVAVLLRRTNARVQPPERRETHRGETPDEILRRRYAAGELDEDEYLIRLSGLSQPQS